MKKLILIISVLSFLTNSYSQDFWQQTNGPYGGASVMDFLKYYDSTVFLATTEGIIESSDNGETWDRIPDANENISCLAVDQFGVLYAGAKDVYNNPSLLKSTDEGSTWFAMNTNFWADIRDIIVPYRDTIVVGSWNKGLYRSFDYGATWTQINTGIEYIGVYEIALLSNGELLVGTSGGGVYRSTNWGDSWTQSNNGIPANSQGYRYAKTFFEDTPGHIFTGTHSGIYYSTNYGVNWFYKGSGIIYNSPATCIVKGDQGILYAGIDISHGVYYSTNNGNQWYHLGLGHSIYTMGWDSDSRLYAGGSGDGLYRFVIEDTSWTQVYNKGYTPVEVLELSITKSRNLLASTIWWGFQYTTNDGEIWEKLNFKGYSDVPMVTINDSIIIVGSSGVSVSNDTGKTWAITGNYSVRSLFYDTVKQIVYLGSFSVWNEIFGIYTSIDFGQTWTLLYAFENFSEGHWVNALHVTKTNQYIFASIIYGDRFGSLCQFFRSTDEGQIWELIIEDPYYPVFDIEEDFSGNLYALRGSKILISHDEGDTWIFRSIPNSSCISSDYSGRIYRAYGWGIYYSIDEGVTWLEMDRSGLENSGINDIKINKNNRIYLATENGVFIGEADSIVLGTLSENEITKSFGLSQNYPNPFNPTTNIKYQIPELRLVTIKVYDLLGREVATLVNEEKSAGSYEVEFNASNLSSGIYFYRLQAGEFVETKKMILLR